jgi:type 1 fimbria pilin
VAEEGPGTTGGCSARFDTLPLTDSTVSGNTGGMTGGIWNGGMLTVTHITLTGDDGLTGGISNTGTLSIAGSVVDGGCELGQESIVTSNGYNIESPDDTCGFDPDGTDQVEVTEGELNLGELANNGGPTMTHALGAGSVAIDQIPAVDCVDSLGDPLTTDQRGLPRPAGTTDPKRCDVGAFEVQP